MDHEEMRLECLKMAQAEGLTGDAMTARGDYLYKVARYGKDEADRLLNERELFAEAMAREPADPNVVAETDKATIYKNPPFKDYTSE
jgi:hypothetical protein